MAYIEITLDPGLVSISFSSQVTWKRALELGMHGVVYAKKCRAFEALPQMPLVSDEGTRKGC